MEHRRPLIAGNWKMYKTGAEAVEAAQQLAALIDPGKNRDVMIAPTFTSLALVAEVLKDSPVALGAQNIFWEEEGAFTGEISPSMLAAAGCSHVIIGHSERRQYFGDTDEAVCRRIGAAIKHDLIPVFCIGETEEERESDKTFSVLDKQVEIGLEDLSLNDLETLVVAYEPVWAIGTGKTATSEQAQEVHAYLRTRIENRFGEQLAKSVRILYGGSVKPANISELMAMPDIDGALVGGASLDADVFSKIANY
jgi:triosephosphate isomerase (TIM)